MTTPFHPRHFDRIIWSNRLLTPCNALNCGSGAMTCMDQTIATLLEESSRLKASLAQSPEFRTSVAAAYKLIEATVQAGGTVYACGNGGSTCDAMHLCEELVARYKRNRRGIRAMHFMDPSMLTCWGNDVGFDDAFARCAETFCTDRDVLIAISTSGNSKNVLAAAAKAKEKGAKVIGLLGKDGGKLRGESHAAIVVPAQATERIQEAHITVIHIWCELLETIGPAKS